MKHTLLALGLATLIATAAFAGDKGKASSKTPKEVACAVMGEHKVNIAKATKEKDFADYKGKRYFFCCPGCKPTFEKDPAKFAKAPSIPTPKG